MNPDKRNQQRGLIETQEQFFSVIDDLPDLTVKEKAILKDKVMQDESLRNFLIVANGLLSSSVEYELMSVKKLSQRLKERYRDIFPF